MKKIYFIPEQESTECTGGDCSSSDYGVITSPNYPQNYPNDENQIKSLVVAEGSKVELEFTDFVIEAESSCGYDYVEIIDTDMTSIVRYKKKET